ncbi:uncharacterized protein SCHCODRAFT_02629492 [Schizophyllum commune H4-8]|uniref:uncharacterized protein n=1 Tax=Schizophyllum commune (strain H4-8 / FGSC 9210) TaxID=578458 RepID=UPI00215F1720|nr:uncharacterized protein SCHCODRAFT_02629492 [Schizophyllum commune H4-8]KAI5891579.1 hypothetical protein SCHCODRAFT_02629492 [Schizophyllum commune H4-8]
MSAPTDDELLAALQRLHVEQPGLGVGKAHAQIKKTFPEWSVSSKRIKLMRDAHGMTPGMENKTASTSAVVPRMSNRQAKKEKREALNFLHQRIQEEARSRGWGQNGPPLPGKSKSQAEIDDISRRVQERVKNGSQALIDIQAVFAVHFALGNRQEDSWYPLLPEDAADGDYDYARLHWVHPSRPRTRDATDYSLVERAKVEAILGNPAGVYLLYKALVTAAEEAGVAVSKERIARQLRSEYGEDPIPFEKEVERDTESEAGVQFMALIMDIAA